MTVLWNVLPMLEAASASETSVSFCRTTRRVNSEDSCVDIRRPENLKSNLNACQSDTEHVSVVFDYLYVPLFLINFGCCGKFC
jgi:hypothetical protein